MEARGDCFRHLEGSPLSWWKGVVSKNDIAFFQAGVTDAQRVSIFVYCKRRFLVLTLAFLSSQAYARAVRSDKILHDFIRRLGSSQEELARTKARLAQIKRG